LMGGCKGYTLPAMPGTRTYTICNQKPFEWERCFGRRPALRAGRRPSTGPPPAEGGRRPHKIPPIRIQKLFASNWYYFAHERRREVALHRETSVLKAFFGYAAHDCLNFLASVVMCYVVLTFGG